MDEIKRAIIFALVLANQVKEDIVTLLIYLV